MTIAKKAKTTTPAKTPETKRTPAAYVNWSLVNKSGKTILGSDRGMTIWPYDENADYKSESEKALVEMVKASGGYLEATMKVRIVVQGYESKDRTAEDLLALLAA